MSWVDEVGIGTQGVAEAAAQMGVNKLEDVLLLSEEEWRKLNLTAVQRRKAFTSALQKSQKHWLDVVGLSQYRSAFDEMGVEAITDVPLLGNSEWESLAVKPFHQKKLVKFAQLFTSDDAPGTSSVQVVASVAAPAAAPSSSSSSSAPVPAPVAVAVAPAPAPAPSVAAAPVAVSSPSVDPPAAASVAPVESVSVKEEKKDPQPPQEAESRSSFDKPGPTIPQELPSAKAAAPAVVAVNADVAKPVSEPKKAVVDAPSRPQPAPSAPSVAGANASNVDRLVKEMYLSSRDRDREGVLRVLQAVASAAAINNQDQNGRLLLNSLLIGKETENKEFISFLLDIGVSVTNRDRNLWTPVHAAAYGASSETLLFLLNNGGESKPLTATDTPACYYYCFRDMQGEDRDVCVDILHRLLLDVDMNHTNARGESVLHYACMGAATPLIVSHIATHGADISRTNGRGQTPIDIARYRGHNDVAKMLSILQEKKAEEKGLSEEERKKLEESKDTTSFSRFYDKISEWSALPDDQLASLAGSSPSFGNLQPLPSASYPNLAEYKSLLKPSLTKAIFDEMAEHDLPGGAAGSFTRSQYLAMLASSFPLTMSEESSVSPHLAAFSSEPSLDFFITSKKSFLGALFFPLWDSRILQSLLLVHTKYITTDALFDVLTQMREKLPYLNGILRMWIRDCHMSVFKLGAAKKFLRPLFQAIKNKEKKVKLSAGERNLKDEIAKSHAVRHKVNEHLKRMNAFTCFSNQTDSFDSMTDDMFVKQITEGEYLLLKRQSGDAVLSHRQRPVSLQNLMFHASAFPRWVSYSVLEGANQAAQVKAISRFAQIAMRCLEVGNFASAKHILRGLDHPATARLSSAWKAVPAETNTILNNLRALFAKDDNGQYTAYHAAVQKRRDAGEQCICCFDILLEDMMSALVGVSLDCSYCVTIRLWDVLRAWYLLDLYAMHDQATPQEETAYLRSGADGESVSYLAVIWSSSEFLSPPTLITRSLALESAANP